MQILFPGQKERLWGEFRDSDFNLVDPSGFALVRVQSLNGENVIGPVEALRASLGTYFYEFTPNLLYGYYGAWWNAEIEGVYITQDVPNVFKVEDPREAIYKGMYLEGVRSKLYMHLDMSGFVNKFPRDREILDLMQNSLDWVNAHPPALTSFNFMTLPRNIFGHCLEQGTVILALQALGIFEAGKHFVYSDNGLALTRDRSGKYMAIYAPLFQNYAALLKAVKVKYAFDNVGMRGMFSSTTGYPRSLSRALRGVSKFS